MRLPPICVIAFVIFLGAALSCSRDPEPTTFEEAKSDSEVRKALADQTTMEDRVERFARQPTSDLAEQLALHHRTHSDDEKAAHQRM